jgi:hypothetical protein
MIVDQTGALAKVKRHDYLPARHIKTDIASIRSFD